MIRRRAKAAGIAAEIGCHTFRATGICRECGGRPAVMALAERADRQIGSPDGWRVELM
jgi:hypothetical protein